MQKEQIKNYFKKLKEAHPIYVKASFDKQQQILVAYEWIFKELEKLGVRREFSESLLIWGKEFVDSFNKPDNLIGDKSLSQQIVETTPHVSTTEPDKQSNTSSNVPIEPDEVLLDDGTTVKDVEEIFGGKVERMTEKEVREAALAEKYNALVYRSRKATDPQKVSIEVLLEKKGIDKSS